MLILSILATTGAIFAPVGKWTVASHSTGCSLSRTFVQGDSNADLALTLDASGAGKADVALERGDAKFLSGVGHITLGPDGPALTTDYFGSGNFSVAGRVSFIMRLSTDQMALLTSSGKSADSINIDAMNRKILLNTGVLFSALETLNKCRGLLLKSWDIDPSEILPPPKLEREWFGGDDVFGTAGRALVTSETFAILSVNAAGETFRCRMIVVSRNSRFDKAACNALVAHARFPVSTEPDAQRSSVVKLAAP